MHVPYRLHELLKYSSGSSTMQHYTGKKHLLAIKRPELLTNDVVCCSPLKANSGQIVHLHWALTGGKQPGWPMDWSVTG